MILADIVTLSSLLCIQLLLILVLSDDIYSFLSTKPRDTNPPEFILSFNAMSRLHPPYVTCQVDSTPVDVAILSREVTAGTYVLPLIVIHQRQMSMSHWEQDKPGKYQCTFSSITEQVWNLPLKL